MVNYRIRAIVKRELKERLRSKAFVVSTLALPVIFGVAFFVMYLAATTENERIRIVVVTESTNLQQDLIDAFEEANRAEPNYFQNEFVTVAPQEMEAYIKGLEPKLLTDGLDGVLVVPDRALEDKGLQYYSATPRNIILYERMRLVVNPVLMRHHFLQRQIPMAEIAYAEKQVDIQPFKVVSGREAAKDQEGNYLVALIFGMMLYACILTMGSLVLQSVIREKADRVVEVLLSSVTGKELMVGKILATTGAGLTQMAVWILPGAFFFLLTPTIPVGFSTSVSAPQVLYFAANFILGLMTFVAMFAAVGSVYETPEDAQSGMYPLVVLAVVPMLLATTLINNAANPVAGMASMLPFASIIIMPVRMSLVDVPVWQIVLATAVNIATLLALFPIAGKIYQIGILVTGKPKWRDVYRWLKS